VAVRTLDDSYFPISSSSFCLTEHTTIMLSMCYMLATLGMMAFTGLSAAPPIATIPKAPVTYQGIHRNGIEAFLNIPYGKDTGDYWRFKPPRPHIPVPGSIVKAESYGPACPQPLGSWMVPLSLTNITAISEDCLNLSIVRPRATEANASLPVMVYIHGGSFWAGSNSEITTSPDGLVLESVKNKLPVIHVSMNYRLGGESSCLACLTRTGCFGANYIFGNSFRIRADHSP
jgi:hypothetical protein